VERSSAIYGLPEPHETCVQIDANHGNICRFDAKSRRDRNNFDVVWGVLEEAYHDALKQSESLLHSKAETLAIEERFSALSESS
jgi:hypothetical protein